MVQGWWMCPCLVVWRSSYLSVNGVDLQIRCDPMSTTNLNRYSSEHLIATIERGGPIPLASASRFTPVSNWKDGKQSGSILLV